MFGVDKLVCVSVGVETRSVEQDLLPRFFYVINNDNKMNSQHKFHIGKLIKAVFDDSGMSVTEFAKKLHCSRTNVYAIFERSDIGIEQLTAISIALNHNFLEDIAKHSKLKFHLLPKQVHICLNLEKIDEEKLKQLIEIINNSALLSKEKLSEIFTKM